MKSPLHHLKHPEWLFDYFHNKIHHAFVVFGLAMIGMLWGASNILITTSASWQWWWFLNSDFWQQSPSDGNIKYALFGDGTPNSTAYTRLRDSSCVPTTVATPLYATGFLGWSLLPNTIYVLNPGTYTLISPIVLGDCSALIGKSDVYIKSTSSTIIALINTNNKNKIIIDNLKIDGQNLSAKWISLDATTNLMVNNVNIYNSTSMWIYWINGSTHIGINNSKFFNNPQGWYFDTISTNINNSQFFNNTYGVLLNNTRSSINNSQFFNNTYGIHDITSFLTINNSIFLNNILWLYWQSTTWIVNNISLYNNTTWLKIEYSWYIDYYGTLKFFGNTTDYIALSSTLTVWSTPPWSRNAGQIESWSLNMDYDRVTNPQNSLGSWLLNGTSRTWLRWPLVWFDITKTPIRYIFGWNILKQNIPVWYNGNILEEYGNNGYDYITTKYITELESGLSPTQQLLVDQYFWSWSIFTKNWQTNWCSLSAFQVRTLNPTTYNSYNFEDHTLYMLTGGEYIASSSNGFTLNGNCIALIGNGNTRFTKSVWGINSVLYANNKRNIIIDNIKFDALYYSNTSSNAAQSAIKLDGASNNSTINNIQAYNASAYGIYLGLSSHHNTIINVQVFNNLSAGIHLNYSSNYNVINNAQIYNNNWFGIWFANGSNRNTMNNIQVYNNIVWIFGDLTTKENVINRAAIYNNSDVGIYFKNSSNNMLNDVRLYTNGMGIRTLYTSLGNKYYGELKFFDNWWGNFDGTSGSDEYLSPGAAGLFPYAGVLSTWTAIASCLYTTNPILSGNWVALLNSTCSTLWYVAAFQSPYTTYVNYVFGLNMYKQKVPVRYDSGNVLIQIPSQYDSTKYIAEMFASRDNTPEGVTFISSGSTQLNSRYTTNIYTAWVLNVPVPVTLLLTPNTSSWYLIISGNTLWLTWIVNNGDTLQIRVLTRTWYNETVLGTITIWSVTTQFTVTTRWFGQTPNTGSFAFLNLIGVPLHTFTWSTTTIAWLETGVLASITFDPITTSGRLEIYSGTTMIRSGTTWLIVYNWNQIKAIGQSSSLSGQTVTGYVHIGMGTWIFTITTKWSDITPPTTPTITYPLTWEQMFFVTFDWTASIDTGAGIAWYMYQIAEDANFTTIINTGFITTVTWSMGSPNTDFDATKNKHYLRIAARDGDGNYSSRSNTAYFTVVKFGTWRLINQNDANLRTQYDSNEITLEGIKTWLVIWASLDGTWTIYQNGADKGTGTFVQNGDNIYVSMQSSNSYNRTVSSVLTIANRSLELMVTTKQSSDTECTLSDDDKTTVQTIFDSLVSNYTGDSNKFEEFLSTMKSMLTDEIDFTNDCNLKYLEGLINDALGITLTWSVDTGTHIAPNCKEYPISFDADKTAYTSPAFKVTTFFANRDSLARYIDSKNPGDCHLNTYGVSSWVFTNTDPSKHIAPNGKLYVIQYTAQWYTTNEFTIKKYFSTVSALRSYIDSKNVPEVIRSHQVDTSFTPQTYIAPNNKSYTIYKTDRWYMSYKLMKVRYFSTLANIQAFINTNNSK